jgi:hypothetical protein
MLTAGKRSRAMCQVIRIVSGGRFVVVSSVSSASFAQTHDKDVISHEISQKDARFLYAKKTIKIIMLYRLLRDDCIYNCNTINNAGTSIRIS